MANIFQQYLAPPKSVMDYSADLDQADARRQSLQQNALTLAAGQQKFDEQQQANQRTAQLRAALMGLPAGATDDQRIQAMRGTATPEGFAAADALSKSLIEQRKGAASAANDEANAAQTNLKRDIALHDFHAQKLATVQTPEDALAWAQEGKALGLFNQPGQYERGIAAIQQAAQSPQTFAQWKAAAMQGGQSVTEQLKQQLELTQQAESVRHNKATEALTAAGQAQQERASLRADARAREQLAQGKVPSGYRQNPDGTLVAIPGGPADQSNKAPTEFQGKSAAFGARAEQADKILTELQAAGPTGVMGLVASDRPGILKSAAESVPLIGGGLGNAVNSLSPYLGGPNANQQRAEQAQRDFVNAVLRQESGAAISASEFDNARKQYFPQPGDSAAVIEQKAANRKLAVQGLMNNAGHAAFSAPAATPKNNGLPSGWSVEVH